MIHVSIQPGDIIPSHQLAQWLLVHIHRFLDAVGLSKDKFTEEVIYVAVIVLAALAIGWLLRHAVLFLTRRIMMMRNGDLGSELVNHKVLIRCSHIIPPLVILALLPFALTGGGVINTVIYRGLLVYTAIVICRAVCSVATFVYLRIDEKHNKKNLPFRGVLDTILGILWVITAIICVAIVADRSPAALLTGLGAFAAVLMLVFKDSILGLVAGLQLSQNDMLRVGDWIVVPSTQANGVVTDVSLTVVKVRNWDNTIVTLPPYQLVSGSFQNWRGMSESGARNIGREVIIDVYSISSLTADQTDAIVAKFPTLTPFVSRVRAASSPWPVTDAADNAVNGTIDTNLGLFRAYLCQWLIDNPLISKEQQILVRLMAPTPDGYPLQVWCFTATTAWIAYEAVQSALFEHIAATAPAFGLRLYNDESGSDTTDVRFTPSSPLTIENKS